MVCGTGPIATENQFPCRTPVACLDLTRRMPRTLCSLNPRWGWRACGMQSQAPADPRHSGLRRGWGRGGAHAAPPPPPPVIRRTPLAAQQPKGIGCRVVPVLVCAEGIAMGEAPVPPGAASAALQVGRCRTSLPPPPAREVVQTQRSRFEMRCVHKRCRALGNTPPPHLIG